MMNMNGLLNGTKSQVVPNGTAPPNPNQKNQVALPRCNDVNVIGKTGEGNKPYICKGKENHGFMDLNSHCPVPVSLGRQSGICGPISKVIFSLRA